MIFEYDHMVSHHIVKAHGDRVLLRGLGVINGMLCCSFNAQCLRIVSWESWEMMPFRTEELSDFIAASPFNSFITFPRDCPCPHEHEVRTTVKSGFEVLNSYAEEMLRIATSSCFQTVKGHGGRCRAPNVLSLSLVVGE